MPTSQRNIRNTGIYVFSDEEKKARDLQVFVACAYESGWDGYENYKYPVAKGFYGYYLVRTSNIVIESGSIDFQFQRIYNYDGFLFQQCLDSIDWQRHQLLKNTFQYEIVLGKPLIPAMSADDIVFKFAPHVLATVTVKYGNYDIGNTEPQFAQKDSDGSQLTPPSPTGFVPSAPYANSIDGGFTNPYPNSSNPGTVPCNWTPYPGDATYNYIVLQSYGPGSYQVNGEGSVAGTGSLTREYDNVLGLVILGLYRSPGSPATRDECTIVTFDYSCNPTQHDAFPGTCNWKLTPSVVAL